MPLTPNSTIPITGRDAERIQAIGNTAGFHFAFIEQGGASLYQTLAFKARPAPLFYQPKMSGDRASTRLGL